MSGTTLVLTHTAPIPNTGGGRKEVMRSLINALEGYTSGAKSGASFDLYPNGTTPVAASGTITLTNCAAGTEVEVNGVKFRAISSGTPTVANGEFVISGTDAADATSLVAAINGSTDTRIAGVVTASSTGSSGVVTVTAVEKGLTGNAVTIKTNGVVAKGTCTVVAALTDIDDTVSINGVAMTAKQQRATGTLTAATAIAGDTFAIDGITFTGAAGAVTLGTPTFSIDTGDNETATSIAAQINAHAQLSGKVTATASSAVVTVRAVTAGTAGNSITLAGTASTLEASAATLENGAAVANNEFDFSPGSTATQVAADIVRCVGASTSALISDHVTATNEAGVVTFWAKYPGTPGNHITLASSDADGLAVTPARLAGGTEASSGGAQATGTLTLTSVANGETCAVNGVTLTAHTNTDANNQFRIDGDDTADAAALARAINNSTTAALADVIATSSNSVVTVTARRGGVSGNAITLSSGQASIVANVTRLAGGAAPTTVAPNGARLASGVGTNATKISHTF